MVNITKLLKLNNVTEWSGTTIKEREQKIREAALVLAGQCVAILLGVKLAKILLAKVITKGFKRNPKPNNQYKISKWNSQRAMVHFQVIQGAKESARLCPCNTWALA